MSDDVLHFADPIAEHYVGLILPRRFFELGTALTPGARSLYLQIVWRCNVDGTCYESVENLGEHAGMGERTARGHLKTLVKMRMVSQETRNGETHLLRLVHPEHWRTPASPLQGGRQNLPGGAAKSAGVKVRPGRETEGGRQNLPPKVMYPSISSPKRSDTFSDVHTTLLPARARSDEEPGFEDVELPDLAQQVADAWNENRGKLSRVLSVNRLRKSVAKADAYWQDLFQPEVSKSNPVAKTHTLVDVVRLAAKQVQVTDTYLKNGYGLDNLLAGKAGDPVPKLFGYYEKRLQVEAPAADAPKFTPGQKLWHKAPWMREREAVTVDRSRAGGKVFVYRGDETSGPMIEVEAAHLTPRGEP